MKYQKSILIITVILISSFSIPQMLDAQEQNGSQINFEITLLTSQTFESRELLANYIKKAVKPLGIDVDVQIVMSDQLDPIYQNFVQKWDGLFARLAVNEIWTSWPAQELPNFAMFHSDTSWVQSIKNTQWNQWLKDDIGYSQNDVDEMIVEIVNEQDLETHKTLVDDFSQFYMENLLYHIPLIRTKSYYISPDDLFTPSIDEGLLNSLSLGMRWLDVPTNGIDENTIRISANMFFNFNNDESLMADATLMTVDSDLSVHPNLAIQWDRSDWVVNDTLTIPNGKHKFLLRNDAFWYNISDSGERMEYEKISVEDIGFAFDMEKALYSDQFSVFEFPFAEFPTNRDHFSIFSHYEMNKTENSITFFNYYPSIHDPILLSQIIPRPEFRMNQTLSLVAWWDNTVYEGTPYEIIDQGVHPYYLDIGSYWDVNSGPYFMAIGEDTMGCTSVDYVFDPDYYFPNEWDAPNGDFIIHEPGIESAKYNIFNATEEHPKQKPTTYHISKLQSLWNNPNCIIEDRNELRFLENELDLIAFHAFNLNPSTLDTIFERQDISVSNAYQQASGQLLAFDVLNDHVNKSNVRKAIAHAINKNDLIEALDGHAISIDSPVWWNMKEHYKDDWAIPYDYTIARDLMREEGYWAAETNREFDFVPPIQETQTVPGSLTLDLQTVILTILLITFSLKFRRLYRFR